MRCEEVRGKIFEYHEGTLGAEIAAMITDHLDDCVECRKFAEARKNEEILLRRIGMSEPSYGFEKAVMRRIEAAISRSGVTANEKSFLELFLSLFAGRSFVMAGATALVILIAVGFSIIINENSRLHRQHGGGHALTATLGAVEKIQGITKLLRTDGTQELAMTGMELVENDRIEVEPGSMAHIMLGSGVKITFYGKSSAVVHDNLVELFAGKVIATIRTGHKGFSVRTENVQFFDKGTVFSVEIIEGNEGRKVSLEVREGSVLAKSKTMTMLVEAGELVNIGPDGVIHRGRENVTIRSEQTSSSSSSSERISVQSGGETGTGATATIDEEIGFPGK